MRQRRLLEEYIASVLCEDDTGGVYSSLASADMGMMPYGMSYGDDNALYKAFVRPFTDVVGVALGKSKELAARSQTLLRVAFEAVATSLIPVLRDSYAEVFQHEHEQLERIRRQYRDVYERTWEALFDNDVMLAAFLCSPAAFITVNLARKSPAATVDLISVLSGGKLDHWLTKVRERYGLGGEEALEKHKERRDKLSGGQWSYYEGLTREGPDDRSARDVVDVLGSDAVRKQLEQSDVVRRMSQVGTEMVRGTLKHVYDQAQHIAAAKNVVDIGRIIGREVKGLSDVEKLPVSERGPAEQALLATVKKSAKEFYVKNLEGQLKAAQRGGAPKDCQYVQDYMRTIQRIKAL